MLVSGTPIYIKQLFTYKYNGKRVFQLHPNNGYEWVINYAFLSRISEQHNDTFHILNGNKTKGIPIKAHEHQFHTRNNLF